MPFITKQFKLCAAHKYWNDKWDKDQNYKVFGDDIKVHGHNYILDITITGPINQDSGFIFDIQELKDIVNKNVIDIMDHSQIQEDIAWFDVAVDYATAVGGGQPAHDRLGDFDDLLMVEWSMF